MSTMSIAYLVLVLSAFAIFGASLFAVQMYVALSPRPAMRAGAPGRGPRIRPGASRAR